MAVVTPRSVLCLPPLTVCTPNHTQSPLPCPPPPSPRACLLACWAQAVQGSTGSCRMAPDSAKL
eukprot:360794-Chlamydomonas_euryale.AAC.13